MHLTRRVDVGQPAQVQAASHDNAALEVIQHGHVSLVITLHQARRLLLQDRLPCVIIAGVDSLLSAPALRKLQQVGLEMSQMTDHSSLMDWSATEAKAKFSELLRQAQREAQRIRNRGKLAAVVLSPAAYERMGQAAERGGAATVDGFLQQVEQLKAQWGAVDQLELPPRTEAGPPPELGSDDSRCIS